MRAAKIGLWISLGVLALAASSPFWMALGSDPYWGLLGLQYGWFLIGPLALLTALGFAATLLALRWRERPPGRLLRRALVGGLAALLIAGLVAAVVHRTAEYRSVISATSLAHWQAENSAAEAPVLRALACLAHPEAERNLAQIAEIAEIAERSAAAGTPVLPAPILEQTKQQAAAGRASLAGADRGGCEAAGAWLLDRMPEPAAGAGDAWLGLEPDPLAASLGLLPAEWQPPAELPLRWWQLTPTATREARETLRIAQHEASIARDDAQTAHDDFWLVQHAVATPIGALARESPVAAVRVIAAAGVAGTPEAEALMALAAAAAAAGPGTDLEGALLDYVRAASALPGRAD